MKVIEVGRKARFYGFTEPEADGICRVAQRAGPKLCADARFKIRPQIVILIANFH